MVHKRTQSGFTLIELLVTLALVLILISAVARMGKYVRTRADIRLTESAFAVIDTALQQYHTDFGSFPPMVVDMAGFQTAIGDTVAYEAGSGTLRSDVWPNQADWPSAALFYMLHHHANSRSVIGALSNALLTNKDASGVPVAIQLSGGQTRDMIRLIDPWGTSLWYLYAASDVFPRVISAGPDKVFGTPDDIEN